MIFREGFLICYSSKSVSVNIMMNNEFHLAPLDSWFWYMLVHTVMLLGELKYK